VILDEEGLPGSILFSGDASSRGEWERWDPCLPPIRESGSYRGVRSKNAFPPGQGEKYLSKVVSRKWAENEGTDGSSDMPSNALAISVEPILGT